MRTGLSGLHAEYLSRATQIRVVDRPTQLPPVSAYEDWLTSHRSPQGGSQGHGRKSHWTAAKLRRAVIMKRGGSTQSEIGTAIGLAQTAVCAMFAELPPELRP